MGRSSVASGVPGQVEGVKHSSIQLDSVIGVRVPSRLRSRLSPSSSSQDLSSSPDKNCAEDCAESGASSLSNASSSKGSRQGHVKYGTMLACFSTFGGDRVLYRAIDGEIGDDLGLLVAAKLYVFLTTGEGLLGTADSVLGCLTELLGDITELAFFVLASGLELLYSDGEQEILGLVTGLEILGINTGLAVFGTVIGLSLLDAGLESLGTVTGLTAFGTVSSSVWILNGLGFLKVSK